MKIKDKSVELQLHHMLTGFLPYIDNVYKGWRSELVITSGSESGSRHGYTSLHYATPAQAIDIRSWETNDTPDPEQQGVYIRSAAERYCSKYDIPFSWIEVIVEGNHIHIEYQPKRPQELS